MNQDQKNNLMIALKAVFAAVLMAFVLKMIGAFKSKQNLESLDGLGNADGTLYDAYGQVTEDPNVGMTYDQITSPGSDDALVETPQIPLFNYPDEIDQPQTNEGDLTSSGLNNESSSGSGGDSGGGSSGGGSGSSSTAAQPNVQIQTLPILTTTHVAPTLANFFGAKPNITTPLTNSGGTRPSIINAPVKTTSLKNIGKSIRLSNSVSQSARKRK